MATVFAVGLATGVTAWWLRRSVARAAAAEQLASQRLHLATLAVRLMSDPLPRDGPEAAYLFHQLDCNLESILSAASELARRYPDMRFLVVDVDNDKLKVPIPNGFGAAALLRRRLYESGIATNKIDLVAFDHDKLPMIHTLVEAELAVNHAKEKGIRSLLVVAVPFHLPRAAMTAASVALRRFPELRIYSQPGAPLAWRETAVHSQGMVASRLEFLDAEMDRIERYTAKGDIAPIGDLEPRFS